MGTDRIAKRDDEGECPSPAEIAAHAALIREGWSEGVHRVRAGLTRRGRLEIREVVDSLSESMHRGRRLIG